MWKEELGWQGNLARIGDGVELQGTMRAEQGHKEVLLYNAETWTAREAKTETSSI